MKVLFVFVLCVQLVYGTDTCSLTCKNAIDMMLQLEACKGYTSYTYTATTIPGTFDEVREECLELGGDLLQNNFGPEGSQYHNEIRQIAGQYDNGIWIGYSDRTREGSWRYLNGELYDANDLGQDAVTYWYPSAEPNNGAGSGQNCGQIYDYVGTMGLDDLQCDKERYGLCEFKVNKCLS